MSTTKHLLPYTSDVRYLVEALRALHELNASYSSIGRFTTGVCGELDIDEAYALVKHYSQRWPKYSGIPQYPVPSPVPEACPMETYVDTDNKFEGEYGKLRIELLEFLIDEIQRDVDEMLCDIDPEDVLEQDDTIFMGDMDEVEPIVVSQAQRAGIDDSTDCCTFMEMNGRNAFVTEV